MTPFFAILVFAVLAAVMTGAGVGPFLIVLGGASLAYARWRG